ncbi:DNA-3-methyladenine glycosylase [Tessaracoccus palaemonis]|uniref:Putative 3-methyladenine DNA glycosylase n=2 Tax=Tessaracoccus palaemonis TaxID=2829499 RepID=A0ABX8SQH7_9ACTN|nr:DNA-3-methyladenine glycosylase [Tessaracoccus palaemonis]
MLDGVGTAARGLLGASLVVDRGDGRVAAEITEVEAYGGGLDPAAHSYRGPSARNAATFGPPWHAYVYRHLGIHTCFNVVVGDEGVPSAVLIRAARIVDGVGFARERRAARGRTRSDADLAAGPARLTVALGIDIADTGSPLDGSAGILLTPRAGAEPPVSVGPRIGVGSAVDYPLRFWVTSDLTVSR